MKIMIPVSGIIQLWQRWNRRKAERERVRWFRELQKLNQLRRNPMLRGYRTYLCAAGIVIVAGVHALGWIDDKTYQFLFGILGGGGLAALRAAK